MSSYASEAIDVILTQNEAKHFYNAAVRSKSHRAKRLYQQWAAFHYKKARERLWELLERKDRQSIPVLHLR